MFGGVFVDGLKIKVFKNEHFKKSPKVATLGCSDLVGDVGLVTHL